MLRNTTQDLAAQFVIVVKGELAVRPSFASQQLVGTTCRLTRQPMRSKAASTRRALVAGQLLTERQKRKVEG